MDLNNTPPRADGTGVGYAHMTAPHPDRAWRGVALLTVLAVLTILALLAAAFAVLMTVATAAGRVSITQLQADALAKSALEHAQALLRQDVIDQPGWDDTAEQWAAAFQVGTPADDEAPALNGVPAVPGQRGAARWVYVRGASGTLVGRYAVMLQDEAGKININSATALSSRQQQQGVGTFETLLTDGGMRGLPISAAFGRNILMYRYGRDGAPGQRGADDNNTAALYATDEIDNNANGVVDEPDEGVDEPEEYNTLKPAWDDRAFASVQEVASLAPDGAPLRGAARQLLRNYSTVYTRTRDAYYDEAARQWRRQINLNVGSRSQVTKMVRAANDIAHFEPLAQRLQNLVANVIDYRDENHVLSTVGSEYGVEAVCFNEIMANDGSFTLEAEGTSADSTLDRYNFVHRMGIWYNIDGNKYRSWPIASVGGRGGGGMVLSNGVPITMQHSTTVRFDERMNRPPSGFAYADMRRILDDAGGWPADLWKNSSLKLWSGAGATFMYLPILGNTRDTLQVGFNSDAQYQLLHSMPGSSTNSARIDNLWRPNAATYCLFPGMSDFWAFPTRYDADVNPPDNLYYFVYIGEQNFNDNIGSEWGTGPWKGYNRMLDVDGDPAHASATEMEVLREKDLRNTTMTMPNGTLAMDLLRWSYLDKKPVRAQGGFVPVCLTTCPDTGFVGGSRGTSTQNAFKNKITFDVVYVMRPDIIELINISAAPISLRNWRVVINTGSYADQVGLIDRAPQYNMQTHQLYDNPNPSIPPNGYFYLTNHRGIFDMEYGGKRSGEWGDTPDEQYACAELPDVTWGVRYKITRVRDNEVRVEGARWRPDQMKYEMIEFHGKRLWNDRNGLTGTRKSCRSSSRDTLRMQDYISLDYDGVQVGDDAIIVGMPREGGFLSMTLKDEYGQVAARTTEYGSTDPREINYSTEKLDPTHYNWVKSRRATFGGNPRLAQNHSLPTGSVVPAYVKNNQYVSVGEIQRVRKAEDWQNIGTRGRGAPSTATLKALGNFFTVAGVRLDPEEAGAHLQGWKPAFGRVRAVGNSGLITDTTAWAPGLWEQQTLRLLSGELKGESFAIARSTQNGITVTGYSTPGGQPLRANPGDQFSVGPGYATPSYYTRNNGDAGVWEWRNKGLERNRYGLYLYGLCDSIDTTEFLEENHNAVLEVAVWNFETQAYDQLPLPGEHRSGREVDAYEIVSGGAQHQYEKNDGVYVGQLHPQHISPSGGVRLRLVARGLDAKLCSGTAWFDYAYLAPSAVFGKINVNTAPERVLSALNGVTPELAHAIAQGIDATGRAQLKPYRMLTDVLNVRGMTPDIFTRMCNLATTRSDQFRVMIMAQAIVDVNRDGTYQPDQDQIGATVGRDVIVDRSELADDDPNTTMFHTQLAQ